MNLGPLADMHPVEQAIRAQLNDYGTELGNAGFALDAVLDLHKPDEDDPHLCGCCFNAIEEQYEYPCPTVKAIANALGVKT